MSIGVQAAMMMTPAVFAIQFLAVHIWQPQSHPVEQMVLENFTVEVALLAVISTTLLAPLVEEMLFRGIFQHWLDRLVEPLSSSMPSDALVEPPSSPEETVPQAARTESLDPYDPPAASSPMSAASERKDHDLSDEISPRDSRPAERPWSHPSNLPILLTSVCFAALHLPQWPAPLAILLLSMAMGIVYKKTGSLLASITLHATFNGINTLFLLLAALSRNIQATIMPASWGSWNLPF